MSYPYSYQYGAYGTNYNGAAYTGYPTSAYGNQIVSAYPQSTYYGGSMYGASPYTNYYPKYSYSGANNNYYSTGNSYAVQPYYPHRQGSVRNFLHRIRHPQSSYYQQQYYNSYPMGAYDYNGGYRRSWTDY